MRFIIYLFTLLLLQISPSEAGIGAINSFQNVEKYLPPINENLKARYRTWIFIDIDKVTLFQGKRSYVDAPTLKDKNLPDLITKWHSEGARIFFLTARRYVNFDNSINQLKSLGINMDLIGFNAKYKGEGDPLEKLEYYRKGILFTDNDPKIKGSRLVKFLAHPHHETEVDRDKPETIVFIDDVKDNVTSVSSALSETQFKDKHQSLHYPEEAVAEAEPARQDRIYAPPLNSENVEDLFPNDLADFKYTEEKLFGGSGGVYILTDKSNTKYTLKVASSPEQIKEEIMTDALYRAFGVPVPAFMVVWDLPWRLKSNLKLGSEKGPFRIAHFIEKDESVHPEEIQKKIPEAFVVDSFLSNWDVTAAGGVDNTIMDKNKVLWRIDNGGGLRIRAQGSPKTPSDSWNPYWVTEINTLTSNQNPTAQKIYGTLKEPAISEQVKDVIEKFPGVQKILRKLGDDIGINFLEDLDHRLVSRYRDLKIRYGDKVKMSPIGHKFEWAVPNKTSASTFIYMEIKEITHVLLGKRVGTGLWGNLGGASDPGDKTLAAAAVRETYEESMGLLRPTEQEILSQPSHDLLTTHNKFGFLRHRMYFYSLEDELDLGRLKLLLKNPGQSKVHHGGEVEYTDFKWVPVSEILNRLQSEERIKKVPSRSSSEEETTIEVDFDKEKMPIHPPFYRMLAQGPVHTQLQNLAKPQKLFVQNTQGWGHDDLQAPIDPKGFQITWDKEDNSYYMLAGKKFLHIESLEEQSYQLALTTVKRGAVIGDIKKVSPEKVAQKFAKVADIKYQAPLAGIKKKVAAQAQDKDEFVFKEEEVSLEKVVPQVAKVISKDLQKTTEITADTPPHPELQDLQYSQTEAFMRRVSETAYKAYEEDKTLFENVKGFIEAEPSLETIRDPSMYAILEKILESEQKHRKHFFSFYSSTESEIGFLTEVMTEARKILEGVDSEHFKIMRGVETPFVFAHVLNFLNYYKETKETGKAIDYSKGYQDQAISASAFLLGAYSHSTESAIHYFGRRQSIKPPPLNKILESFFKQFGISVDVTKYIELYESFYEPDPKNKKNTSMFEILINPDVMDKITYNSTMSGETTEFILGLGDQPKKPLLELMKDPKIAKDLNSLKDAQFKIYLDPRVLQDTNNVRIKQYWRYPLDQQKQAAYDKKLKQLIYDDLTKALHEKTTNPEGTYRTVGATKSGTISPTERVFAEVYKQALDKEIAYIEASKAQEYELSGSGYVAPLLKKLLKQKMEFEEKIAAQQHLLLGSKPIGAPKGKGVGDDDEALREYQEILTKLDMGQKLEIKALVQMLHNKREMEWKEYLEQNPTMEAEQKKFNREHRVKLSHKRLEKTLTIVKDNFRPENYINALQTAIVLMGDPKGSRIIMLDEFLGFVKDYASYDLEKLLIACKSLSYTERLRVLKTLSKYPKVINTYTTFIVEIMDHFKEGHYKASIISTIEANLETHLFVISSLLKKTSEDMNPQSKLAIVQEALKIEPSTLYNLMNAINTDDAAVHILLKRYAEIETDQQLEILQIMQTHLKGMTDIQEQIQLVDHIKKIPADERLSILRLSVDILGGLQDARHGLFIFQIVQEIPAENRWKIFNQLKPILTKIPDPDSRWRVFSGLLETKDEKLSHTINLLKIFLSGIEMDERVLNSITKPSYNKESIFGLFKDILFYWPTPDFGIRTLQPVVESLKTFDMRLKFFTQLKEVRVGDDRDSIGKLGQLLRAEKLVSTSSWDSTSSVISTLEKMKLKTIQELAGLFEGIEVTIPNANRILLLSDIAKANPIPTEYKEREKAEKDFKTKLDILNKLARGVETIEDISSINTGLTQTGEHFDLIKDIASNYNDYTFEAISKLEPKDRIPKIIEAINLVEPYKKEITFSDYGKGGFYLTVMTHMDKLKPLMTDLQGYPKDKFSELYSSSTISRLLEKEQEQWKKILETYAIIIPKFGKISSYELDKKSKILRIFLESKLSFLPIINSSGLFDVLNYEDIETVKDYLELLNFGHERFGDDGLSMYIETLSSALSTQFKDEGSQSRLLRKIKRDQTTQENLEAAIKSFEEK